MAKPRDPNQLLEDLFIVNLLLAGVPQRAVQKIVSVDIGRVNRIGKLLRPHKKDGKKHE